MALSKSRTRTQTTLTKLSERVATVHGELAYVEARLGDELAEQLREGLARRRAELLTLRESVYGAVRQYDVTLDPTRISTLDRWLKPFGRGRAAMTRYELNLIGSH